ncbi:carboxypeptidase-like regulatory domain-containing protein [Chitinophaga filiformis]|uniref:carboxypeptidase-like regulatory domain-containing protein n=1 Tax=Chitinophaga filiformis TaxID=104663 RepID=UPI001F1B08EA|nr:carboxypeptidase-like regulatory domain-containing protein [Chitinophaga filiformis]MCF6405326.1 carboxypeptidase-like regulatory domain-containing protein [Chitinophaga filiformis]
MKQLLFALYCCLNLTACTNWDITGPAGPEGPQGPPGQKPPGADTSTIYGRVYTIDELTFPIVPVDSVKVTLHVSPDSSRETMADSAGFYYFHGVGTGTYELTYSRPGFGEMKLFGLTHISGGTLSSKAPDILLLQIPVRTVVDTAWFLEQLNGDLALQYNLRIPFPEYQPTERNLELYFSHNSNVNVNNYQFRIEGQNIIRKTTLDKYFAPGDSMYCRIYTLANYFISDTSLAPYLYGYAWMKMKQPIYYIDPATGLWIYPSRSMESALAARIY